jgi:hypothetical protein
MRWALRTHLSVATAYDTRKFTCDEVDDPRAEGDLPVDAEREGPGGARRQRLRPREQRVFEAGDILRPGIRSERGIGGEAVQELRLIRDSQWHAHGSFNMTYIVQKVAHAVQRDLR